METINKRKIMDLFEQVYDQAEGCKLTTEFFESVDEALQTLSEYMQVTKEEAFFVVILFTFNYRDKKSDISGLVEYFQCNPLRMLEFHENLENLEQNSICTKTDICRMEHSEGKYFSYGINPELTNAILLGLPIPKFEKKDAQAVDVYGFLEQVYIIGVQFEKEEIHRFQFQTKIENLIARNNHILLIQRITAFNLEFDDLFVYLFVIWNAVVGVSCLPLDRLVRFLFSSISVRISYLTKLVNGNNKLIYNDLIELDTVEFIGESKVNLSDKSKAILEKENVVLFFHKEKHSKLCITPDTIAYKQIHYSDLEMKQIQMLQNCIEATKFGEIQNQLSSKGMAKGVCILLHGAPGTGKTETVKQLAKASGRGIYKVDISAIKTKWYGESEKNLARIFKNYRQLCEDEALQPILLFNEADAVFSKRRHTGGESDIAQTENTLQNILLEELENFEGILMATTNLQTNIDSAFDRRFLFKIEFQKPGLKSKSQIWQNRLSFLSPAECNILAERFDFSGGQIDNIVRKCEIHQILHQTEVDFVNLQEFCRAETYQNMQTRIGFVK